MEIKTLIEYQKKDGEKIKLERQLNNNENKKIYTDMISVVKSAQQQSALLENNAANIIKDYDNIKKSVSDNLSKLSKLKQMNIEKLSEEEIATASEISQKIYNNLAILEKQLLSYAEKINQTLNEFEQAKKRYIMAKDKHRNHKEKFEIIEKEMQPKIQEIEAELAKLEKSIDKNLIEKYKHKRLDRIFPIVVPVNGKSCGGCFTELPMAKLSQLKEQGFLECENCRRIIYID